MFVIDISRYWKEKGDSWYDGKM